MNNLQDNEFSTPKVKGIVQVATSTVDHAKSQRPKNQNNSLESSLGILSLNDVDLSNIAEVSRRNTSAEDLLKQQRELANNTLEKIAQVGAVPSRLLHPDLGISKSISTYNLPCESTVNESDLVQTPKNTSTPRNSSLEKSDFILRFPRESIFSKIKDMLDGTDISTDNAVEEFKQIAEASKMMNSTSSSFIPAEKAQSRLLADELSWRHKYEIPNEQEQPVSTFLDTKDLASMSIGEFFHKKCDNISELRAQSPSKSEPIALIDITSASNIEKETESVPVFQNDTKTIPLGKSFSISAIQQLISEKSTTNVLDYLCSLENQKQGRESSEIFSVPVSQNVSYTTSFSDNEAVKVAAKKNKENVSPAVKSQDVSVCQSQVFRVETPLEENRQLTASAQSSRSSSAMSSLPNGKLPIESTVNELIWGCVKVDRCVTKQFMVRNKTEKTLRLQCSLSSYEFKIRKDSRLDSDILNACKLVLHGHESRTLIVSFIPTKIGAAIDELVFTPLDGNLKQTKKQCVRLWGYGGYASNEYQNISRDNTGKYWLSLGRMDNRVEMAQIFTIKNTGILPSFAYVTVASKQLLQEDIFTNLRVEPGLFVLLPNQVKTVTVTYTPTAKDCRLLKQKFKILSVMDIGKLDIITGPEVSRARLKRLNRKATEKGLMVDDLTKILSTRVPGEVFPSDLGKFKENPSSIPELLGTLSKEEMVITIEQDPNQTLVPECPEDSIVYQSLCSETTKLHDESVLHNSCRLEPPSVVLFPPNKPEDSLFLISESAKKLHFEVVTSPRTGLIVTPTIGEISPGETAEFKIKLPKSTSESHFKIGVYVENDVFEAEVKVLNVVRPRQNRFLD